MGTRFATFFAEVLTHRAFKGRPLVRISHWMVMLSFPILFLTLVSSYFQIVRPGFSLFLLGHFPPYEWLVEFFALACLLGILALFVVRARNGGALPWRRAEVTRQQAEAELANRDGSATSLPRRFLGSTKWQAVFVEAVVLLVAIAVLALRVLEYWWAQLPAKAQDFNAATAWAEGANYLTNAAESSTSWWHHPISGPLATLLASASPSFDAKALSVAIALTALAKILTSMIWMMVVGAQTTMGVAWHRFTALVNVFARRDPKGGKALGALEPIRMQGEPLTAETLEDLPEDARLGVETIHDFTWKGLLDFTSCTECGRCQELCPAWATGKPLSPKLFTLALRDHHASATAFAKAADQLLAERPELNDRFGTDEGSGTRLWPLADMLRPVDSQSTEDAALAGSNTEGSTESAAGQAATGAKDAAVAGQVSPLLPEEALALDSNLPLVAHTGDVLAALQAGGAAPDLETGVALQTAPLVGDVIVPEALWACTTCGACVEQCPVDIEHIDHIVDLRRNQVLMESAFPKELAGVFRKMESKGNPYGKPARKRMEWAKNLDFEIPEIGVDVEDATEVDYLLWVGCAGSFDDKAMKTTAAIAELLHLAEVSFGVLGQNESCTGDPARRAGNEVLFQMLAAANVEMLNEVKATKIIVSCAHCFNTIGQEYPQLGGKYEVLHHTQVLNRLVREGHLRPVPPSADEAQKVTYHDPCYLGRHNGIYSPPRELLGSVVGSENLVEMPRHADRAMCCGGGGARAWTEESTGVRIASARSAEAEETGATLIATACPFCTQMLDSASPKAQVQDVALSLLDSVKRGQN
ncbi:(Fe-S)-binding protein [Boudabousia tangfeifanii]|uniref:(Fe-S)-binding protein n=1 Tax=Boudabousia tangfeifanii TaxID=1912795 RepID=UPI001F235966|nr:(Fe-S)-binding protein [Boudabousia tangfeifanii]